MDELTALEVLALAARLTNDLPCDAAPPGYAWSPVNAWALSPLGDLYRWLYERDRSVAFGHRIIVSVEDLLEHEHDGARLVGIAHLRQSAMCSAVVAHRVEAMVPGRTRR